MLLRKQPPEASFKAIPRATEPFEKRGLRVNYIFDAVRQFGPEAAAPVLESAKQCACKAIVAFGMGGDELSVPTNEFRPVYEQPAALGLHRLIPPGEVGGPWKIRDALEGLGAEQHAHVNT